MRVRCLRCGLGWSPRSPRPTRCPNCKSTRWNTRSPPSDRGRLGIAAVVGDRRAELVRLGERLGLRDLRVFGSVARGGANERSDLDLVVTPDPSLGGYRTFGAIADFNASATRLLGRRVDAHTAGELPEGSPARRESVAL